VGSLHVPRVGASTPAAGSPRPARWAPGSRPTVAGAVVSSRPSDIAPIPRPHLRSDTSFRTLSIITQAWTGPLYHRTPGSLQPMRTTQSPATSAGVDRAQARGSAGRPPATTPRPSARRARPGSASRLTRRDPARRVPGPRSPAHDPTCGCCESPTTARRLVNRTARPTRSLRSLARAAALSPRLRRRLTGPYSGRGERGAQPASGVQSAATTPTPEERRRPMHDRLPRRDSPVHLDTRSGGARGFAPTSGPQLPNAPRQQGWIARSTPGAEGTGGSPP
jgi:hypothetical protein